MAKRLTRKDIQAAAKSGLAPDDIVGRMVKSFEGSEGGGRVLTAKNAVAVEDTVPTGIPRLDRFLHGGLWMGRVTEVSGPNESGKTSFCLAVMACICREMEQGHPGLALYVDAERAWNEKYATMMGVDVNRVLLCKPQYGQQAFQRIYEFSRDVLLMRQGLDPSTRERKGREGAYTYEYRPLPGGPWTGRAVAFIDSLAALMSLAEFERIEEGTFDSNQMAEQARMSSVGFREIIGIIDDARVALVITNQQRENISKGPMQAFGPKKTTPGGSAPLYYASVRLETGRREQIKDGAGEDAKVIGQYLSIRCRKSKVYSKFEGEDEIKLPYTARGIDFGMLYFDTLMTLANIKKNGAWYSFDCEPHPYHGRKFQGSKPYYDMLASGEITLEELERIALGEHLPKAPKE